MDQNCYLWLRWCLVILGDLTNKKFDELRSFWHGQQKSIALRVVFGPDLANDEMNPCVSDVVIQSLGDLQKNDCSGWVTGWVTLSAIIMEVENHPKWKETNIIILEGAIFHFHDYGKKVFFQPSLGEKKQLGKRREGNACWVADVMSKKWQTQSKRRPVSGLQVHERNRDQY